MMQQLPVICKIESFFYFIEITKNIGNKEIALNSFLLCIFLGNLYGSWGNINSCDVESYPSKVNSVIACTTP